MQLLVKIFGVKGVLVDVDPLDTIQRVKEKVQDIEGFHPDAQRLYLYVGTQLLDQPTSRR